MRKAATAFAAMLLIPVTMLGCGSSGKSDQASNGSAKETTAASSPSSESDPQTQAEVPLTRSDKSSKTKALSKAETIKQGDTICTRYKKSTDELQSQFQKLNLSDQKNLATNLKRLAPIVHKGASEMEQMVKEFAKLTPPKSDVVQINSFISLSKALARDAHSFGDATATGDMNKVLAATQKLGDEQSKASSIATAYGFKVCGAQ